MKMESKIFRRKDLILILPCLIIAGFILLWYYQQPSAIGIAVVEKDGQEVCRIDLSKQQKEEIISIGGKMNVKLKVEPGAISFYQSDCPDKICIRTGKLTKPGQSAVCLPGKVSVRIIAKNTSQKAYDAYTG